MEEEEEGPIEYTCTRCENLCFETKKKSWNEGKDMYTLMCEECMYRVYIWSLNSVFKSVYPYNFLNIKHPNSEVIGKAGAKNEIIDYYKSFHPNKTVDIKIEKDNRHEGVYELTVYINGKKYKN